MTAMVYVVCLIRKGCWIALNAFSASAEIVWLLSFIMLIRFVMSIDVGTTKTWMPSRNKSYLRYWVKVGVLTYAMMTGVSGSLFPPWRGLIFTLCSPSVERAKSPGEYREVNMVVSTMHPAVPQAIQALEKWTPSLDQIPTAFCLANTSSTHIGQEDSWDWFVLTREGRQWTARYHPKGVYIILLLFAPLTLVVLW